MENKLKRYGYNELISEEFNTFISLKHHSRFEYLIKWLRANELAVNELNISTLYKADVVVRRMLSEILKPIELSIQAKLMSWVENNNITVQDLTNGKHYECINCIPRKTVANKINTWSWMNGSIQKIRNKIAYSEKCKKNSIPLSRIISDFTFGQLSAIISLFPQEIIKDVFNFIGDKKEYCLTLEKIVELRNSIAHHSIIFNDKSFNIKSVKYSLKEVIESLSMVTWGNYRETLKDKIISYRNNTINKYHSGNEENKNDVMALFDAIVSYVISV